MFLEIEILVEDLIKKSIEEPIDLDVKSIGESTDLDVKSIGSSFSLASRKRTFAISSLLCLRLSNVSFTEDIF